MRSRYRILSRAVLFYLCSFLFAISCSAIDRGHHRLPALPPESKNDSGELGHGSGQGTDPISPAPEPASLILFGSGLLVLGGVLRRRSRKLEATTSPRPAINRKPDTESSVAGSLPC